MLTLGALSVFSRIEMKMPRQFYAHYLIRFLRETAMPETEVRALIAGHGFTITNLSYRLSNQGRYFEYRMVIRTLNESDARRLAATLCAHPAVLEFRISPTGD